MVSVTSNGEARCTSPHLPSSGRPAPPSRTNSTTSPMSTSLAHLNNVNGGHNTTLAVGGGTSTSSVDQQSTSSGKVNVSSTPPSTPRSHKDDGSFDLSKAACGKSYPFIIS